MVLPGRKSEQSDRTRASLTLVARRLFSERGYAATPTEEIVQEAGVTRGALYHHFRDKDDLFEAVYREMQGELMQRLSETARNAPEREPWVRLHDAFHTYLDFFMDPAVQRVMLIDAPAVFGWERWRYIDGEYSLGRLMTALERLRELGLLGLDQPVETIAHLMMAMTTEAALVIAGSEDAVAARAEAGAVVDHFLDSLRAPAERRD